MPRPEGSGRPTVLGDTRAAREARTEQARINGSLPKRPGPKEYVRPEPVAPYINCDDCGTTYNLTPEQDNVLFRRMLLTLHYTRPGIHDPEYVAK